MSTFFTIILETIPFSIIPYIGELSNIVPLYVLFLYYFSLYLTIFIIVSD